MSNTLYRKINIFLFFPFHFLSHLNYIRKINSFCSSFAFFLSLSLSVSLSVSVSVSVCLCLCLSLSLCSQAAWVSVFLLFVSTVLPSFLDVKSKDRGAGVSPYLTWGTCLAGWPPHTSRGVERLVSANGSPEGPLQTDLEPLALQRDSLLATALLFTFECWIHKKQHEEEDGLLAFGQRG